MNWFGKMGFLDYNGSLQVNRALTFLLHEAERRLRTLRIKKNEQVFKTEQPGFIPIFYYMGGFANGKKQGVRSQVLIRFCLFPRGF